MIRTFFFWLLHRKQPPLEREKRLLLLRDGLRELGGGVIAF